MTAMTTTDPRADVLYVPAAQRAIQTEGRIDEDGRACTAADVWNPPVLAILVALTAAEAGIIVTDTRRDGLVAALMDDDADMRAAMHELTRGEI